MPQPARAILDVEPLRDEVTSLPDVVRQLAITDEATLAGAATILRRIKTLRTTIADLFRPHIARAFEAHRAVLADRHRLDVPLVEAEGILKRRIAAFTVAEEARRLADARRQAAAAEEARITRLWQEVEDLEEAGYHGEARELVGDWVSAPPRMVVTPPPVRLEGIQRREVWHFDVIDVAAVPREYLTVDQQKLGAGVRALKGTTQIPGVRIWAERTVTVAGHRS